MGRLLLSLLLALALVQATGPAGAQQPVELDILQLYQELQVAQPNGFPRYEIAQGPGGGTVTGGILYGPRARLSLVLDQPRAFLRITDRGDADTADAMVTEFAAWLDPDGAPLVALSEWGERRHVPFGGRLRFYSRASGRWNLVTGSASPRPTWPVDLDRTLCRIDPAELDEMPDVAEDTAAWEGLGVLVALLPRSGTDIAVWCVAPSPVAGTGAQMVWDRGAAAFRRGAPLAGPPPWAQTGVAP